MLGNQDPHGSRRAVQGLADRFGNRRRHLAFLLRRAAFGHVHFDNRHGCFSVFAYSTNRMDTLPSSWKRAVTLSPGFTAMASVMAPLMTKLPRSEERRVGKSADLDRGGHGR